MLLGVIRLHQATQSLMSVSACQNNKFMHLTNFTINKDSETFIKDEQTGSKRYHKCQTFWGIRERRTWLIIQTICFFCFLKSAPKKIFQFWMFFFFHFFFIRKFLPLTQKIGQELAHFGEHFLSVIKWRNVVKQSNVIPNSFLYISRDFKKVLLYSWSVVGASVNVAPSSFFIC